MKWAIAIDLTALVVIFVLSFIFPVGDGENQTEGTILLVFIAVPAVFLAGRFVDFTQACVFGIITGALAGAAWIYGTFLAYEAGWRGLTIEDFQPYDFTVHEYIKAMLLFLGAIGAFFGFFLGVLGHWSQRPPWSDVE